MHYKMRNSFIIFLKLYLNFIKETEIIYNHTVKLKKINSTAAVSQKLTRSYIFTFNDKFYCMLNRLINLLSISKSFF